MSAHTDISAETGRRKSAWKFENKRDRRVMTADCDEKVQKAKAKRERKNAARRKRSLDTFWVLRPMRHGVISYTRNPLRGARGLAGFSGRSR